MIALVLHAACTIITDEDIEEKLDAEVREAGSGDADTDADGDADADADGDPDIAVDAISPWHATTTGGVEVTITGRGFGESPSVTIDGVDADVLGGADDQVVVLVPPREAAGAVDVAVDNGGYDASVEGGFTYFTDGTGLTGIIGSVEWYDVVGGYWGGDVSSWGTAQMFLVEPVEAEYWTYLAGEMDSCSPNTYDGGPVLQPVDGRSISPVTLRADSAEAIALEWDRATASFKAGLDAGSQFAGPWDLEAMAPEGYPEFAVENVAEEPSPVSVTTPAISNESVPTVASGFSINWSNAGSADYLVIYLALQEADNSGYEEISWCVVEDDGAFTVPRDIFTDAEGEAEWPAGRQIYLFVGRAKVGSAEIPYNHATSGMIGLRWTVGVVTTR